MGDFYVQHLVKTAWAKLDHRAISQRGYEQTGPKLPLEGPIMAEDVGDDLLPVFRAIDPHEDEDQLGTSIREEAKAMVDFYWGVIAGFSYIRSYFGSNYGSVGESVPSSWLKSPTALSHTL